ncbi:accessory Sec system glycosyltransferase GtfA [Macrococcoides goetzii]|uniref:accessory Sec system glycosyltransferase GtfA n=1 Tax=Macrococcus sp. PK TaxID=2801919 RepID=UPI001F0E1C42|nr:accessory Sec system glycosyltransferase GtfA [Macrococcus sp. PK]MCH4985907.1 accessory Sec system glycosyltransferase GtfA [Macrococcus sp. PK]
MTIYNINYGIGFASSGVEYAQKYRGEILRQCNVPLKFIFLDYFNRENIQAYTSKIGFMDEEIISLYQYFTDVEIAPSTYSYRNIISDIAVECTIERNQEYIVIKPLDINMSVRCKLVATDQDKIYFAEYYVKDILIKREHFSYTLTLTEYFNDKKVALKTFHNKDGSIAYSIYLEENVEVLYDFEDNKFYNKAEFVAFFMQSLRLTTEDIVIIDRSTKLGASIVRNKGKSKMGIVIHAEHFSEQNTNDDYILWNNHYEYMLNQVDYLDFIITSTQIQTDLLLAQLKKYYNKTARIYTIPVGSLKKLARNRQRTPYSIITASRLAKEKHIDWIIKAVMLAHKEIPSITLDVYGEGGQKRNLVNLIRENHAESYIYLKGHRDLKDIYSQYELFVSASTSEGFGLTLMEATGSGLALIGFDVNYGNPTFIQNKKNGFLIPYHKDKMSEKEKIMHLKDAIIEYFMRDNHDFSKHSYSIAQLFLEKENIKRWKDFIEEMSR